MKLSLIRCAAQEHYRLVVVGGGTAGCAVASKFSRILPRQQVAVIEPQKTHYYQPGFTLAAAGLMDFAQVHRDEQAVLPRNVDWLQSAVRTFTPINNKLQLQNGQSVSYDFLVLATGIELRFDMIEGLPQGRQSVLSAPNVCSVYFPEGAQKMREELDKFEKGTALFTFPSEPIKCAGAPLKIAFLAEEIFRRRGIRSNAKLVFCTAHDRAFSVPKYADVIEPTMKERGIGAHYFVNLVAVHPEKRVAEFEVFNESNQSTGERKAFEYSLLHIGPPCSPVDSLREHAKTQGSDPAQQLTDAKGWVRVDPHSLQSPAFSNVFAIGDCTNTQNAKTAAAISSQLKALSKNLRSAMEKHAMTAEYDGYASCPLVVDRGHVMLAEFTPEGPLETFPYNQSKPSRFAWWLNRYMIPSLYWSFLLNGRWEGPATIRHMFEMMGHNPR